MRRPAAPAAEPFQRSTYRRGGDVITNAGDRQAASARSGG
jgi:hypothetical protein